MENEWDLVAAMRGYSANPTAAAAINEPLPSFLSDLLPIYGEQNSFGFHALGDGMMNNSDEGLQEIYYDFCYGKQAAPTPTPTPAAAAAAAASIMPVVDDTAFNVVQPRQDFMQIQENVQFFSPAVDSPPLNLSAETLIQLSKKGRRKNYQPKLIRQMTKDELFTDNWAWRKYGQKPIKGFANPRSYYKCSSSKGCSARKQVELYTENPETYVVTYSGEHSHPKPTRRSSLSGSTRTRFANPAGVKKWGRAFKKGSTSTAAAPPPAAAASFSPDTPSTESESAAIFDDLSMTEMLDGSAEDDETIAMLANQLLNDDDDFFAGVNDSDDFPGAGDFFSGDFLSFGGASFDGNGGF